MKLCYKRLLGWVKRDGWSLLLVTIFLCFYVIQHARRQQTDDINQIYSKFSAKVRSFKLSYNLYRLWGINTGLELIWLEFTLKAFKLGYKQIYSILLEIPLNMRGFYYFGMTLFSYQGTSKVMKFLMWYPYLNRKDKWWL